MHQNESLDGRCLDPPRELTAMSQSPS